MAEPLKNGVRKVVYLTEVDLSVDFLLDGSSSNVSFKVVLIFFHFNINQYKDFRKPQNPILIIYIM